MNYSVTGVTATGGSKPGNGVDFRTVSGKLTFAPGGSGESPVVKYVTVPVYGDVSPEVDETFGVTLSNVAGGAFVPGVASGTGTIVNDDTGTGLRVGVGDASVVEGASGSRMVRMVVTISAAPGATAVAVPYTIAGVNATWSRTQSGGGDFGGATSGTLTFAGSTVSKTLLIPVYGDRAAEGNETVHVTLGAIAGASAVRPVGTLTIRDDD